MIWSPWITHTRDGFPAHILPEGTLVEVELIDEWDYIYGKVMWRVGQEECTQSNDSFRVKADCTTEGGWRQPHHGFLAVDRYRYAIEQTHTSVKVSKTLDIPATTI